MPHLLLYSNLYNVKTKTIVADFTQGNEIYTHIEKELHGFPVGILVNNVGIATEHPMKFCSESLQRKLDLMRVNTVAVTVMTMLLLPAMLSRRRGAIVNVASGFGVGDSLPHAAVYAATKVLTPLFVSSNMTAFSDALHRGNLFLPSARDYARHAVATLGKLTDTSGYWTHGLQLMFFQSVPDWLRATVIQILTYFL